MKRYAFIPVLAAMALAGCSGLNDQDRQLLTETHSMAQESKSASMQASQDAKAAKEAAQKALDEAMAAQEAAKAASDKADRMFEKSQNK
jgi:hypothetical protein